MERVLKYYTQPKCEICYADVSSNGHCNYCGAHYTSLVYQETDLTRPDLHYLKDLTVVYGFTAHFDSRDVALNRVTIECPPKYSIWFSRGTDHLLYSMGLWQIMKWHQGITTNVRENADLITLLIKYYGKSRLHCKVSKL